MRRLLIALLAALPIVAVADSQSDADGAVADVLFEYEYAEEFASYRVNDNGFVDITFAGDTPNELYSEILGKLQNHPRIDGVLAGKGGWTCGRF